MLINPVNIMFRPFRYELILSFYYNAIAPFGLVRFKDFFVGDILTSMVRPLTDMYFIGCYFGTGEWEEPEAIGLCKPSFYVVLIVSLIPFHIRFW
jgi:hypothetical protein